MKNSFSEYIINPFLDTNAKFPINNAFCINEIFYSYRNFSETISKIRLQLQALELISKNIGIVANDDIETYASIWACWLEGLAYVPLHPMQPIDRSQEIISQANVEIILDSKGSLLFQNVRVINTTDLEFTELSLLPKDVDDQELAYILFTSGSTGKPKGVSLSRLNIGAFMKSFFETGIEIDENDRCLQAFDLTFDVSVQSFLVPLVKGACTYTIPHDQIKYSYVYGLLDDHQLTFGAMAPSMIRYLKPYFDEIYAPSMKYNILTAEASPYDLVKDWMNCIPNARIFDFYGPTEATIYCTYYEVEREQHVKTLNGMLSIGKPMPGLTAIVVDEGKVLSGSDKKGELCISGPQVTPGYWNNEEKNTSSFIQLEVDGKTERYYKTGDSCYFDEDGDIMLAGRLDYQVKIQGYRIELSEIEFHARECLKGKNAVAIPFQNSTDNTELALFYENDDNLENEIRQYLKMKLPPYMIPTRIIREKAFPINTNGKVDRILLKKLLF